jgi:biotin synthase
MELCCGGILGIGETSEQRLELAFELRELKPVVIPVNLLNPRQGTPLGGRAPLHPLEALKYIAIFRIILPESILLCAGVRPYTPRVDCYCLTHGGRQACQDVSLIF